MKKKFTFLMAALMLLMLITLPGMMKGQMKDAETLYSETFGTTGNKTNVGDYEGYSSSLITPTSTAWKISQRTTSPCDITGSSGDCNAYCGTTGDIVFNFVDELSDYTEVKLSFNYYKGAGNNKPNSITCYISSDGGETYGSDIIPSNTGAVGWYTVTNITIPDESLSNLCIKFSNTSSNTNRLDDILLTGVSSTPTPTYTITAVSNNESYGTVSGTTTITANPADGYRVIAGDGGYTVTAGTATVINNGDNTFSVTPSTDCTVQINFEEIPSHTLFYTVSPAGAGTVTLGSTSILEGATTTATATANASYKFTGWSITGGGATVSNTTDNPVTVTMGNANATITATFEAVTTYEINWSVNGSIVKTENVEESTAITFAAPTSGIPAGYTFKGWVVAANQIDGVTDDDPSANYVTYANSTGNITYYAVMAESGMSDSSLTIQGSTATFSANDNIVIVAKGTSYALYQETINTSYVKNYTFVNNASTIGNDSKNYLTLTASNDSWLLGDATNGYLTHGSSNNLSINANGSEWDIAWVAGQSAFTIKHSDRYLSCRTDLTGSNQNLYRMGGTGTSTGTAFFDIYKYTPSTLVYNHFCTTINTFDTEGDWDTAGNWSWGVAPTTEPSVIIKKACTITNGVTAHVNNIIMDGGSLIIADGGQLICSNSVAATVHKTIDAWANNSGWYLLSSPIQDATITSISNLITTESGYDFFRYNESKSTNQWENYKNEAYASDFTSFERGRGYLYRNAATQDVTFTGSTNTSVTYYLSYANAAGDLKGFNIIGNPFTHDITWDDITLSNVNEVGYYTLGKDGGWTVHTEASGDLNTNKIAPMQGFLVQAEDANPSVTFGAAKKNNENKANNDYIKFVVNYGKYNDVTYALFDKGDGINKIDHRNAEIPMLYISQDGKNYAIATMGDDTQMFDLSFEAKTMGTYTISMNAKGNFSYIHLIDRLTGDDTNLLIEDYSFIGSPQDNAERFIVKLSYDNGSSTGSETFAYQIGNEIIVNGEGTLEVYDVTGRKVMTTTINGVETINGLNSGVYVFRVIGETLKTQKIVVR